MFDPALETLPPEQVSAHQWRRFRAMARDLLASNPFVRAKWRAAGVRSVDDLVGWDDFRRLPHTRKDEFVEDQAAHPPFGSNLTYPLERYVRVHQTSGTSGQPTCRMARYCYSPTNFWTRCRYASSSGAGTGGWSGSSKPVIRANPTNFGFRRVGIFT